MIIMFWHFQSPAFVYQGISEFWSSHMQKMQVCIKILGGGGGGEGDWLRDFDIGLYPTCGWGYFLTVANVLCILLNG